MLLFLSLAAVIGLTALIFFSIRLYRAKPWLPNYVKWKASNILVAKKHPGPRHIMFLFVDHFEPWEDTNDVQVARSRMESWTANYPIMAARHRDADGVAPQHTWFYLVEDWRWQQHDGEFMRQLGSLCYDGFGEVELHLHHGAPQRIFPEVNTAEKLQNLIEDMKTLFRQSGALVTGESNPSQRYGFIHGKWALANSMNGLYCGVDSELEVLSRTGCYADFTMPSGIESQAKKINSIYYPSGDLNCPRSYDRGIDVQAGVQENGKLMLLSGMMDVYFRNLFLGNPIVEKSNIDSDDIPTPLRIDRWIKCNIHVKDRPEWVFVKVHTHGARQENFDVCFGKWAERMHAYLEEKYNDGERYKLHYVTAREAYNIVKAAEAGESGDPSHFRDYRIKPYANRKIRSNVPYQLLSYNRDHFKMKISAGHERVNLEFKETLLRRLEGRGVEFLEYVFEKDSGVLINLKGKGTVHLFLKPPVEKTARVAVRNARVVARKEESTAAEFVLEAQLRAYKPTTVELQY